MFTGLSAEILDTMSKELAALPAIRTDNDFYTSDVLYTQEMLKRSTRSLTFSP